MKKLLYTFAVVATALAAAGCAREIAPAEVSGDTVTATFTVDLPASIATKALGDNATELKFFVYDKDGVLLDLGQTVTVSGRTATVNVDLVKDFEYQFAFWAQTPGKYTITAGAITIPYASLMNDADADAFWARFPKEGEGFGGGDTYKVTGPFSEDVTLTRPFAQINVGAVDGDFDVAEKSGLHPTQLTTSYTISGVPNVFTLLSGASSGTTDVAATAAAIPGGTLTVSGTDYDYAAMLFVLPMDNATVTLNGTITADNYTLTREVPNVPIKANYRTNILGRIFTVGGSFNVTVDGDFGTADGYAADYVPEYATIAALNDAFAQGKGVGYQVAVAPADPVTGPQTITLPNTTDEVSILFRGDFSGADITIAYSDVEGAGKPAKLTIEAPLAGEATTSINKLIGNLTATTVVLAGTTTVDDGELSTADHTLVIKPNAWFKKLTIKKGGVKVEKATEEGDNNGKISELTIDLAAGDSNVVDNDGTIEALVVSEGNVSVEGEATYESVKVEGGSATIEAAVTTVVQKGTGEVTIAEGVTVSEIQAEDESKVTTAVTSEEALRAAIAANQGGTIVLGSDIVLTDGVDNRLILPAGSDIAIDLNGHSIKHDTRVFQVYNAKLTVVGPGSLEETKIDQYSPIMVIGSTDSSAQDFSVVNVSNLTLKGWSGIFVNNNNACAYGVKITATNVKIEGLDATKEENALYINGTINKTSGPVPDITLNNVTADRGIYAAGYGKWTLNDCNIADTDFAMEIRAGELTVNSGSYEATATTFKSVANGNGSTTSGAALSVSQHSTELPIKVVINGGTFTGLKALYEKDVQTTPSEGISLSVTGGTFNGEVYSQNCTDFITGGTFTKDPTDYVDYDSYRAYTNTVNYIVLPAGSMDIPSDYSEVWKEEEGEW